MRAGSRGRKRGGRNLSGRVGLPSEQRRSLFSGKYFLNIAGCPFQSRAVEGSVEGYESCTNISILRNILKEQDARADQSWASWGQTLCQGQPWFIACMHRGLALASPCMARI